MAIVQVCTSLLFSIATCSRCVLALGTHSPHCYLSVGFLLEPSSFNLHLVAMTKDSDVVVLGADAVMNDGSIVNKVGSLAIALAAKRYRVPLIVLAEKTKGEGSHRVVEFEASDPEEVRVRVVQNPKSK